MVTVVLLTLGLAMLLSYWTEGNDLPKRFYRWAGGMSYRMAHGRRLVRHASGRTVLRMRAPDLSEDVADMFAFTDDGPVLLNADRYATSTVLDDGRVVRTDGTEGVPVHVPEDVEPHGDGRNYTYGIDRPWPRGAEEWTP